MIEMDELGVVNSNGAVLKEEERLCWSSARTSSPPVPTSFSEDCLSAAEEVAAEVLNCIHPTLDSDENRRDVIDHIHKLIKTELNCEVFPYGSVPLKTYLPDGDIDLTVLRGPRFEDSLAQDILAVLQREGQKKDTDYQVMDTQFIDAEVKLVKCLVRNIVIDISFNQLGGLSALCFLEQVDRLVGKNHLFKRSIILVKAWCFYESRILGAMHGLVSTYALETLILYIFHLFHSSLSGPLTALYRFLDYYSQFDWDNYCISLKGPVCKASLPNIVVKMPNSGWNDLLLGDEFLDNCVEMFSVPYRGFETNQKAFQTKHLNIIDPLKENNNLGRSVQIGNFYRIRSAFKYGARKLRKVLSQPRDKIADGLNKFFSNILLRHGNLSRNSIRQFALEFGVVSSTMSLSEESMLQKSLVSDCDKDNVGIGERESFSGNLDRCVVREIPVGMTEASNRHKLHVNNGINGLVSSTDKPSVLENTCDEVKEMGSSGIGGELDVINPLADLAGDYDSHIRSLLHGQLCHGFATSAFMVSNPPSSPFRIGSRKRYEIARHTMPLRKNSFAQSTTRSGGKPNKRSSEASGMNKMQGSRSQFLNDRSTKSYGSGTRDVLPARSRSEGQSEPEVQCQSTRSVIDGQQTNINSSSPFRIEFGSIGNLAEELLSRPPNVSGSTASSLEDARRSTATINQERIGGPLIPKNEDDCAQKKH